MNTAIRLGSACAALCLLSSCTSGFEELNRNPLLPPYVNAGTVTPPTDKPIDPKIPARYADIALRNTISEEELAKLKEVETSLGATFRNLTYEGLVDDYQRTTNLTHDIYAGYFAHNQPTFNTGSPCYAYTPGWSDRRWNHFYQKRTDEYRTIAKICYYLDREKYHNAFYIARIYYAFLISTLTDTYGDIPITPMIDCEPLPEHATYQPQEEVYDKVFRMLAEAIEQIDPSRPGYMYEPADDKCFGGDVSKWIRFANTLRLRLALRISNVDPARARTEGEAALTHPAGVMRSQEDRMRTVPAYAPIDQGGYNEGGRENDVANCSFRYLDAVMSKDLEIAYKTLSADLDPRCPISWFRPTPKERLMAGREIKSIDFNGCEIGNHDVHRISDDYSVLRVNAWADNKELSDTEWFGYSREYIWLGYAECKFLQAEAALRGWAGAGGSAESLYLEGIRESMRYYHLADNLADAYILGLVNKPFSSGSREEQLEAIITQKWLAIFPNGNEGWAEYRRTDYPRLRYPLNNLDPEIPDGKFIKRVSYPNEERVSNGANVPVGVNQSTRLWWDVMDTNASEGVRNTPNNFR